MPQSNAMTVLVRVMIIQTASVWWSQRGDFIWVLWKKKIINRLINLPHFLTLKQTNSIINRNWKNISYESKPKNKISQNKNSI